KYTNLAFPLTVPKDTGQVVGTWKSEAPSHGWQRQL
ncbi:hypothetical protein OBE_17795, partial [human gut metagenome]